VFWYSWQGAHAEAEVWISENSVPWAIELASFKGPVFTSVKATAAFGFPSAIETLRREWQ
jgi:hypothetical protein